MARLSTARDETRSESSPCVPYQVADGEFWVVLACRSVTAGTEPNVVTQVSRPAAGASDRVAKAVASDQLEK